MGRVRPRGNATAFSVSYSQFVWFVLLAIALVVLLIGGLYFRRRMMGALTALGVPRRPVRVFGWAVLWFLFGFPGLVFLYIFASVILGRESFSLGTTGVATWVLEYPFWISLLVMLQSVPYLLVFQLVAMCVRRRGEGTNVAKYAAMAALAIVVAFSIYTPVRIIVERGDLRIRQHDVGTGTGDPLRIAFLADIQQDHHTDQERVDSVIRAVNQQDADVIISGGDWINSGADYIEAAARSAGRLRSRLGTFSVRGDHEHFAYSDQDRSAREVTEALARYGVDIGAQRSSFVSPRWPSHRGGVPVLQLHCAHSRGGDQGSPRSGQDADYSILVTHQFDDALSRLVKNQVRLVLVAHTHGGQVNPVVGVVHVPLARVESRYIDGRYQLGDTTVIVTAGIGYSIAPFR